MTDFDSKATFQNRFKYLKIASHKTRDQIAENLGVSVSAIDRWTQGERRPTRKMQARIADYFNVSINYLMGRSDSSDDQYADFLEEHTEEEASFLMKYRTASKKTKKVVQSILNS